MSLDPLQGSLKVDPLPPSSRYYGLGVQVVSLPDGTEVACFNRRLVPAADRFALLQEHAVSQGERLDNVAAQYVGDPEQFWRICDANNALRPDELLERIGRRLRITLPEGIPAPKAIDD